MRKILLVFAMAVLVALLVLGTRSFRNNAYQGDPPKLDSNHSSLGPSREVNAATITEEREAEYAALRLKIEKEIGAEKLQTLDKLGATIYKKWIEWDPAMGSAQRYFRGGRIGTEEDKKLLTETYMWIKGGQGCLLAAKFHQDPEWRKFTQAYFDY